ncbi:glycosyltransferase [Nocardioides pacificus]
MTAPDDRRERSRHLALTYLLFALFLGAIAWALLSRRAEIVDSFVQLSWPAVLGSGALGAAAVGALYLSWLEAVRDGGVRLSARDGLRVYGVGQAGKYLPGSVWPVLAQAQLGRRYGVSPLRMASASLLALAISVCTALVIGCVLLPAAGREASELVGWAPLLALPLLAALWPPVLNRLVDLAARLLRRDVPPSTYSLPGVLRSAAWCVAGNLLFGLHIMLLGAPLGVTGLQGYVLAVCAYALASGIGVALVFVPAGMGAREAVLVAVLAPVTSVGDALVVALVSRVLLIVVDTALGLSQLRGLSARDGARAPRPAAREGRVVFVTRKFPPSVGGMETLAAGVWRSLAGLRPEPALVAHGGGNRALVWWAPWAVLRVAALLARRDVALVVTGDALMYAVLRPLLALTRTRSATMVMGLDVTYEHRLYRAIVHPPLRRAEKVIAISAATAGEVVSLGVPPERVSVLRLGIPVRACSEQERRVAGARVRAELGLSEDDVLLLSLGRLVRRKGAAWFVGEVLPGLSCRTHLVVAGDGPDAARVAEAAARAGVTGQVHLLGRVSDDQREALLCGADLFVQPNVVVPGDMEGFGLVTIEAGMRGTPVVAADLEGIRDAVVDGETGVMLPTADAQAWTRTVRALVADRAALQRLGRAHAGAVAQLYGEDTMARGLRELLDLQHASL